MASLFGLTGVGLPGLTASPTSQGRNKKIEFGVDFLKMSIFSVFGPEKTPNSNFMKMPLTCLKVITNHG